MPQIKFSSSQAAGTELMLLMMYPDDTEARRRALVAGKVDRVTRDAHAADFLIPAVDARALLNAPSYAAIKNEQRTRTKEGMVVGDLLSMIYLLNHFNREPSMRRALHAFRKYAETTTYGDRTPIPNSEPKVRECWSKFGPVAPLWAALRINRGYGFAPERAVFEPQHIDKLLSVAAGLREFAVSFIPKRTRPPKPVLDPDTTWTMPEGTPVARLNSRRFPEKLVAFLQDYKAPSSRAYR